MLTNCGVATCTQPWNCDSSCSVQGRSKPSVLQAGEWQNGAWEGENEVLSVGRRRERDGLMVSRVELRVEWNGINTGELNGKENGLKKVGPNHRARLDGPGRRWVRDGRRAGLVPESALKCLVVRCATPSDSCQCCQYCPYCQTWVPPCHCVLLLSYKSESGTHVRVSETTRGP